jgi:hypothetical protein
MMSNENNDLVIFEYKAFEERLRECASSSPAWAPVIQACIDKHNGEDNLNKLVEGLTGEAYPQGDVIATWNEISENVDKSNESIDRLIQQFERRNLLDPSKQPLVSLIDALNTLILYSSGSQSSGMNHIEQNWMQKIRSTLADNMETWNKDSDFNQLMEQDPEFRPDTYHQEMNLQNLQKKFREELDYIATGNETDDIFRDAQKINNEIIPDIVQILSPIVGNERFHLDLKECLKNLEMHIGDFIVRAQSNIDKQIKAALDSLEVKFEETVQTEIRPQLQQVSPYLALFVSTEQALKEVREDIKDWQDRTEAFIGEFFQLPKDIKDSCERFREDFKCRDALEQYEQNGEINPEEVKVLKHLFGTYGTDVFSRLNCKPEDLRILENVEKVADASEEINKRYKWQNKADYQFSDELVHIFEHATTRLEDIDNYLMEQ